MLLEAKVSLSFSSQFPAAGRNAEQMIIVEAGSICVLWGVARCGDLCLVGRGTLSCDLQ